jgi:hypothetical protein
MWVVSFFYIAGLKDELILKYKEVVFLNRNYPYPRDLKDWELLNFEEIKNTKILLEKQYILVSNPIEKKKLYTRIQAIDIFLRKNNPNRFFNKLHWTCSIFSIGCIILSIFITHVFIITVIIPPAPLEISSPPIKTNIPTPPIETNIPTPPIETNIPTPPPDSVVCQNAKGLDDILTGTEMKNLLEMPAIVGQELRGKPNSLLRLKICSFCSSSSRRRCTSDVEYSICDSMNTEAVCS